MTAASALGMLKGKLRKSTIAISAQAKGLPKRIERFASMSHSAGRTGVTSLLLPEVVGTAMNGMPRL